MPGPPHGTRAGRALRSAASAVLIVLTCLLVPVTVLTVWVHDIALDTDRYVRTMQPLASDPAIEEAVEQRIVEAVEVRVDSARATAELAAWLESRGLPPAAAALVRGLAPQLDAVVHTAVDRAAARFVDSGGFEKLWTTANRTAHAEVVHALTGKGRGAVDVDEGTVTLDVGAAVDQVRRDLVKAGVRPAANIPDVDKQLVLFQSDELARFQDAAHALDLAGHWMPVITVLLAATGVALAHRRRRALAKTALGTAATCLVVAIGIVVARRVYLDQLPSSILSEAAAAAVFDRVLHFPRAMLRTVIVLGVIVALGAYLDGPGRLPRALRGSADREADTVARWARSHGFTTGRAGTWTQTHRGRITVGVLLLTALVFLLWNDPTTLMVVLLAIILLAALAVIALLAADGRTTAETAAEKQETPD